MPTAEYVLRVAVKFPPHHLPDLSAVKHSNVIRRRAALISLHLSHSIDIGAVNLRMGTCDGHNESHVSPASDMNLREPFPRATSDKCALEDIYILIYWSRNESERKEGDHLRASESTS